MMYSLFCSIYKLTHLYVKHTHTFTIIQDYKITHNFHNGLPNDVASFKRHLAPISRTGIELNEQLWRICV